MALKSNSMSGHIVSSSYRHLPPLLPDEIVIEILIRLPSKSIIRSKTVCKRWRDLINNSQFFIHHLLPARHNDRHLLLVMRRDKTRKGHVFSFIPHPSQTQTLPFPDIPVSVHEFFIYHDPEIEILGPCNGLVCLFDTNHEIGHHIVLWRPADGEIKILPPSDVPHDPPEARICNPQIGFGYDVETEDYKVVRMGHLEDDDYPCGNKIEIYSFKNDSWKGVAVDGEPLSLSIGDFTSTCLNGMLFWWAQHRYIISFRMSDASFGTIAVPRDLDDIALSFDCLGELLDTGEYKRDNDPYWDYRLFVLNDENLALVMYDDRPRTKKCFHVWVLLEFGVKESWTRVFTVGPLVRMHRPIWFWRNGKIILESLDGELLLYDLFTNDMESLNIYGVPKSLRIISIEEKYISY